MTKRNNKSETDFFSEKSTRRDFLKWIGFGTASVALAACKGPVIKSIPYVVKPEEITPGVPTYYSSTMIDSFDIGSVLVKTREGRPIKIEPNNKSKYFNTTSVRIQSSLLSLYDEKRLKYPYFKHDPISWSKVDNYVINILKKIKKQNKKIFILSHSLPCFSTKKLIEDFKKHYNAEWIVYDPISYSKPLDASEKILGIRGFPLFDLNKIELIISFDADFLGDWSPENMSKYYVRNKYPNKSMIQHIQIESNMSITGANADIRISKKPTYIKKMLFEIYNSLFFDIISKNKDIRKIISIIKEKGEKCVVIADGDKELYEIALLINKKINSIALKNNKFIISKESNDIKFSKFLNELQDNIKTNNIGALFIYNINPIYSLPYPICDKIIDWIKKIPLKISFTIKKNETDKIMDILIPIPHWLESWGDVNPVINYHTLIQPTIQKIFNTRQFQDSIIIWSKMKEKNFYEYLKKTWEKYIIPFSNLDSFNEALYHGFLETKKKYNINKNNNKKYKFLLNNFKKNKDNFEIRLYTKIGMGDGSQHNNPWLQEFPDPITRTTWDNYVTISNYDAKKLNIKNWANCNGSLNGNCVNIIKDNKIIISDIPTFIQPGQAIGSIGLSFGYGQKTGKLSNGKNGYKIYDKFNIIIDNIKLKKTNKIHTFASVQLQDSTVGRDLVRETNLNTYMKFPNSIWNKDEKYSIYKNKFIPIKKLSIWGDKEYNKEGHHFNLSIDLNSCIGCGSCIIACNSENNIPVVGKEEIIKSRDMHWLRVDRYYFKRKKNNDINNYDDFNAKKILNPKVSFQPVMCQHCENAPCETVCPVGATIHGSQGQNMMVYNRCVGTRYCANNCPYKIRRFNWFNYSNNPKFDFNMNNTIGKMVINPDVVVRTRGVMEKCSLCIQKTQYTIGKAKKENRSVKDKEFETACSISCPTKAISFGDINNKNSEIYKKIKDSRSYKLLDFIGINPNVSYLLKIRNNNIKK